CPGTLTADAGLAALQDNGGPTETQALKPGSPAIDLVPAAGASCAPTDQRGVPRPQGTACDAGAYEVAPPTATTGPATDLTATAATLTGTTNPNARGTSYHFEFGPTTTYDSRTSDQDAGQGLADVAAGAPLSGLAPTTTYHYRLVATSSDGTTAGADQTFTTPAPPTIPPEPPDTIRPVLTAVSLTNRTFAVSSGSTAVAAKAKRGTKFAYKLSEPATVKISLERATTGRRKGSKCVKATKKLAKAKKCTLYVAAGALTRASVAGRNTVPFTGRVGSHALSVASYRATLVATDAAKNKSKSATVKFKVVKR
ncbi:MAG: hypothetical protein QOJ07_488, partial [Thermoleophilaceae bacterium]|nr:hypothetical protein [Thermoleophilaceae bacterium]